MYACPTCAKYSFFIKFNCFRTFTWKSLFLERRMPFSSFTSTNLLWIEKPGLIYGSICPGLPVVDHIPIFYLIRLCLLYVRM